MTTGTASLASGGAGNQGATGAWIVLTHEQNTIWGGNLLALMAGEFAYAYGMLFAVPALAAWVRVGLAATTGLFPGRALVVAAVFEMLAGLTHGYALLAVGFGSLTLLLVARPPWRMAVWVGIGHALAFCALGFWLWPLLEMHGYTTPNDSPTWLEHWLDPVSPALRFLLSGALVAILLWLAFRRRLSALDVELLPLTLFLGAAVWALAGWWLAGRIGLADLRCVPLALLFLAVAAGWWIGAVLQRAPSAPGAAGRWQASLWAAALTAILIGEAAVKIEQAPRWAQWNFQGAEHKPLWTILTRLFPAMQGDLFSPRLVFEHDPENQALGSTRALETLPLELGGRPVLEGLYMESAVLAPVIYLTQAEVSRQPSSPLTRYPSARLAPARAATHMRMLYADTVLVRSPEARRLFAADPDFERIASAAPFELWRLRHLETALIEPLAIPPQAHPREDWQRHAFDWFAAAADRPPEFWPVYTGESAALPALSAVPARIQTRLLERERIHFQTSAPGQPVLIRVAFHPRWQLRTPGTLHLAAPGFLLVIPESETVELIFADTLIGRAGAWASLAALLFMAALWRLDGRRPVQAVQLAPLRALLLVLGLGLAVLVGRASPDSTYRLAWQAFDQGDFVHAAALFDNAAGTRLGHGRRQEARFWSATALDRAGDPATASGVFEEIALASAGHWVGDSLRYLLQQARNSGDEAAISRWNARLQAVAPVLWEQAHAVDTQDVSGPQ